MLCGLILASLIDTAVAPEHRELVGIASVIVAGIVAQWLAWRMKLPAILLLLAVGLGVGPVWQLATGFKLLDPNHLLGEVLPPLISLSVAVVLFEGGLTLNLGELRHSGQVLWRLVSFGAIISWLAIAAAAILVLNLPWSLAALLGALLVVTGPTVIGPLLRFVRPIGQVGSILKWEGIVIDPIGATLSLLVFECIATPHAPGTRAVATLVITNLLRTVIFGGAIGLAAAGVLVLMLRRYWIADRLQVPMTLALVVASFVLANLLQDEAGLLAVTAMGVALANQRFVAIGHILEFKENLTVLLLSVLFVLLGARLDGSQITAITWRTAIFVAALVVVIRPLVVYACTVGTRLPWSQRIFLAWMAPRGIVAASVASVFAERLTKIGAEDQQAALQLVPITFAVIGSTVLIYGLTTNLVGRRLKLSKPGSRGFVIAGANSIARHIARALVKAGQDVLLVDTNRRSIAIARMEGLPVFAGNIFSDGLLGKIEGTSIGRLLALTSNVDANALAVVHFARHFGRSQVFQLPRTGGRVKSDITLELHGRLLFGSDLDYEELCQRIDSGWRIVKTQISEGFDGAKLQQQYDQSIVPLFLQDLDGDFLVHTAEQNWTYKPGQTLHYLAPPRKAPADSAHAAVLAEHV